MGHQSEAGSQAPSLPCLQGNNRDSLGQWCLDQPQPSDCTNPEESTPQITAFTLCLMFPTQGHEECCFRLRKDSAIMCSPGETAHFSGAWEHEVFQCSFLLCSKYCTLNPFDSCLSPARNPTFRFWDLNYSSACTTLGRVQSQAG